MKKFIVSFKVKAEKRFIDDLVDFSTYDDIKSVYGCEVVEVE